MITFSLWMALGYCSGFVRDDDEMTMWICQSQHEAEHRVMHVTPLDKFDEVYFNWAMKRAIGGR